MSAKRLEAHFEHRTFYFYLTHKEDKSITIDMYNTPYTLIQTGAGWENHPSNKNNMSKGLILAVIETLQIA